MKHTLIAIVTLLYINPLFGQTNVSGNISSNTTWNIAGSPYTVVGNVGVPSGFTLTIAPGVKVLFSGAYQIFVKGTIIAAGKKDSMIIFTSSTPNVNSGATIIKFEGANLSTSKIQYVAMEYALKSIRLGEESETNQRPKNTGTLTVDNIWVTEADVITAGYESNAKLVITNSIFRSTHIEGQYPRSEPISIISSVFYDSRVTSSGYNYGVTVDSSQLFRSTVSSDCCDGNVTVLNSLLFKCPLYAGPYALFTAINSKLINVSLNMQNTKVHLKNSIMTIEDTLYSTYMLSNGSFDQSQLIGYGATTGIWVDNSYNRWPFSVTHSLFYGNRSVLKFTNVFDSSISVSNSNFIGTKGYNVENLYPFPIHFPQNYWGSSHPDSIAAHIFDENDDLGSGKVHIEPVLTEPDLLAPISPPIAVTKVLIGGTVYLSWNANMEQDLAGHRVYSKGYTGYSFQNSEISGPMTVAALHGATISDTIAVTSFDTDADGSRDQIEGRESWYSIALNAGTLGVPAVPVLRTPATGISGLPLSVELRWGLTDRTEQYHVQLAADSSFSFLLVNDSTVHHLYLNVDSLSASTRYYWRVRSRNPQSSSAFSSFSSFMTLSAPPAPSLVLPLSGSSIGQDNTLFMWNRTTPHVTSYHLELGNDSLFVSGISLIDSTLTDTMRSIVIPKQPSPTTFWWRVRARNAAGNSPFSLPRSFVRLTTSVPGESSPAPVAFALLQNFPNPFNPVTTISYDIPVRSHVLLTVYSLLGEVVATPVRVLQDAGRYSVIFDGSDIASGVYFYRLQAGSYSKTGRMILTK